MARRRRRPRFVAEKRPTEDGATTMAKLEAVAARMDDPSRIAQVCARFPQARSIVPSVCR